jgi:uncharacterized protein
MLYMLGTLTIDTTPFSIDAMERDSGSSIAIKPVMGRLQPKEFTGEGEDEITLSGQILPQVLGGMNEMETLQQMRVNGTRFPLMRGDGWRPGWYVITHISERHREIQRNGVGFVIAHAITMIKTDPDTGSGGQIISGLIALFQALKGRA